LIKPNIKSSNEENELLYLIQKNDNYECCGFKQFLNWLLCPCYIGCKTHIIEKNEYGFAMDQGKPVILTEGWHSLLHPFYRFEKSVKKLDTEITFGSIVIVRIPDNSVGLAVDNTDYKLLLPGIHCYNTGTFKLEKIAQLNENVYFGPIKLITVKTGNIVICYNYGKIVVLDEGRYAINDNQIYVSNIINMQQQNYKFNKHKMLLNGGIGIFVEGLITYRIVDVVRLTQNMNVDDLQKNIENVVESEMVKFIASLRLEDISSKADSNENKDDIINTRMKIISTVMHDVKPFFNSWGVSIINFQINNIDLADERYSREYEKSSLDIAITKANYVAQKEKNRIRIIESEMAAEKLKIDADDNKKSIVILANADAEKRLISAEAEAKSKLLNAEADAKSKLLYAEADAKSIAMIGKARNDAGEAMKNEFSQKLALTGQQVKMTEGFKVQTLIMSDGNSKFLVPLPILDMKY